jgi:hypothetical protein
MKRECGACQACCKALPVPSIGKKIGERCQHQKFGTGCAAAEGISLNSQIGGRGSSVRLLGSK